MKVAALYDIHGNLSALQAVLEEVRGIGVDHIVVGGDVVPGPLAGQCLELLLDLELPASFISGNGERNVLAVINGQETDPVPEQVLSAMRWVGQQLDSRQQQMMGAWPGTAQLTIPGQGEVLFCHATPLSDSDIFTRKTPASGLLPIFDGVDQQVVICGHTHMQFDRMIGKTRVVNAGSVGMPFGQPLAQWLLIGSEIQLRQTDYDLSFAADQVRASGYPQAEQFVSQNILAVPDEKRMLEFFEQSALRTG